MISEEKEEEGINASLSTRCLIRGPGTCLSLSGEVNLEPYVECHPAQIDLLCLWVLGPLVDLL